MTEHTSESEYLLHEAQIIPFGEMHGPGHIEFKQAQVELIKARGQEFGIDVSADEAAELLREVDEFNSQYPVGSVNESSEDYTGEWSVAETEPPSPVTDDLIQLRFIDRMSVSIAVIGAGSLAIIAIAENGLNWSSIAGVGLSTAVFEGAHILPAVVDRTLKGRRFNTLLGISAAIKVNVKKQNEGAMLTDEPVGSLLKTDIKSAIEKFSHILILREADDAKLKRVQTLCFVPYGEVLL